MTARDIKKIANWYLKLQLVLEAESNLSTAQVLNDICCQMSSECLASSNLFNAWISEVDKK